MPETPEHFSLESQYSQELPIRTFNNGDEEVKPTGNGVPSLFNQYALFQYRGIGSPNTLLDYKDGTGGRFQSDDLERIAQNPNAGAIIDYYQTLGAMAVQYHWTDFMYCKYYNRIPNNHMITLRRFAMPVVDNILDPVAYDFQSKQVIDTDQPDLARAVTWMGESTGNSMEDVLSWNHQYTWEEIESEFQTLTSNAQGIGGSGALGMDNVGFGRASAFASVARIGSGQNAASQRQLEANAGFDPLLDTYNNYQLGPLDVIKKMRIRSAGLEFNQEFTLKFEYDLRSINAINPKMAFLDLIANLLVLTYSNAPFWGGATRYVGNGKYGKPIGNHSKLASGDFRGFLNSILEDATGLLSNVFGDGNGGFSLDSIVGGLGNVVGDMLGGFLSKNLNTPQGAQAVHKFLSGEPTGYWHLTIGNPLNPIMVVGNLTLQDTKMSLKGPLGRDDFPTKLEMELTLAPGRPRDKAEIEMAFNGGRGRLYHPPEGAEDILNLEGRQPVKITGYGRDPDANGDGKSDRNGTTSTQRSNQQSATNNTTADAVRFGGEKSIALVKNASNAVTLS